VAGKADRGRRRSSCARRHKSIGSATASLRTSNPLCGQLRFDRMPYTRTGSLHRREPSRMLDRSARLYVNHPAGSAPTLAALPSHRYTSGTRRISAATGKAFLLIFAATRIQPRRKCLRHFSTIHADTYDWQLNDAASASNTMQEPGRDSWQPTAVACHSPMTRYGTSMSAPPSTADIARHKTKIRLCRMLQSRLLGWMPVRHTAEGARR